MFLKLPDNSPTGKRGSLIKTILIMKFIVFFLFAACLEVSATGYAQKVSLSQNDVSLKKVFKEIEKQSGYNFFYKDKLMRQAKDVSIHVNNVSVEEALNVCFEGQPLSYTIVDKIIVVKAKKMSAILKSEMETVEPLNIITGSVKDQTGRPLAGVSVMIKGTQKGTTTNANGSFSIDANAGEILEFTIVGYQKRSVTVDQSGSLNVVMEIEAVLGNEVVVVGYGTQKKKDVTGAIASVKVSDLSADVSGNLSSAIQGRVAGVSVEANGGAPGAGLSLTIRGSSTLGNNTPLYVVDGVFLGSLDFVNPQDIESIEILKDASAASIYGSRAANGVVIITTKGGKKNTEAKVQLSGMYGYQSIPKRMSLLNGQQWTKLFQANVGGIPDYNGINTDWQDAIFQTGAIGKANINLSGGTEHLTYNLSGGYLGQDGTIRTTNYSLANFRVKTQYEKGRIKVGETVIYNKSTNRTMTNGSSQAHSMVASALIMPPTVPVYDTSNKLGGWGGRSSFMKNIGNPLANLEAYNYSGNSSSLLAEAFVEVRLIDQLKYKFNVGLTENRGFGNNYGYAVNDGNSVIASPTLSMGTSFGNSWLLENTLSYDKTIGRHSFSLLAGFTSQKDSSNGFGASGTNIPIGLYSLSASTANQFVNGSSASSRRESYLGRVTYSYDSRYLLSASIRRDGSSVFANGYQYGTFPSVSAGWNISNEKFFREANLSNTISSLKLRGSWGVLGNDLIGNYTTQSGLTSNINYLTGNPVTLWQGTIPNGNASPRNLKWEQTKTTNVGIDAYFLENKLSLVADVFKRTTSGVLLGVPVPPSLGITGSPVVNAGEVENKGLEVTLGYENKTGNLNYHVGLNVTTMNNKMTAITIGSGSQQFGDITKAKVGYPLGGFWLIKTDGIFQSDQEVSSYVNKDGSLIQPNAAAGDIKFIDANHDGKIDNNDRQYAGSPLPNLITGLSGNFSWKNWDLNLLFQGTFGNKIFNGWRIWEEKMTEVTNLSSEVLNAWTPQNHSNFPRFILSDPNLNAQRYSDRWLENGSYVRFKRLEIGYTFSKGIINRLKIDGVRTYFSMENIFTITKYKGYNPDIGNGGDPLSRGIDDNNIYPLQRTVMLGLSVTF